MARNGRKVNAKSIMGVMMLAAGKGAKVHARDRRAGRGRGDGGARGADRRLLRRRPVTSSRRSSDGARGDASRRAVSELCCSCASVMSFVAPRHRRFRRHRDRPRAARLARDARGRALHDRPRRQVAGRDRALHAAINEVQNELEALHGAMTGERRAGRVRRVPRRALDDPERPDARRRRRSEIIAEQRCNAEWALTQQMSVLVEQFEQIEDPYLRERKADVVQVVERVLKRLMGKPGALPAAARRGADDPRRARPVAGRRHPVQAAPLRRVPHRPRRRHVAHGDRRAQPQRSGGRRDAQRARS